MMIILHGMAVAGNNDNNHDHDHDHDHDQDHDMWPNSSSLMESSSLTEIILMCHGGVAHQ